MKTLELNLNDSYEVVLTEAGAAKLNSHNADMQRRYPTLTPYPSHGAGEVYRSQMWALFQSFGSMMGNGLAVPFESCRIVVEQEEA